MLAGADSSQPWLVFVVVVALVGSVFVIVALDRARRRWRDRCHKVEQSAAGWAHFAYRYLKNDVASHIHRAPGLHHYPHVMAKSFGVPSEYIEAVCLELRRENLIARKKDGAGNHFYWVPSR